MLVLLGVPPETAALLRADMNLHGEEVPLVLGSVEEVLAGLGERAVEAVAIGSQQAAPLQAAQRILAVAPRMAILLLPEPARHAALAEAMRFTPFLSDEVVCVPPGGDVGRRVRDTLQRHRLRERHRATLHVLNAAPPPADRVRVKAAQYLDRLLVHAPVGVLFLAPEGKVLAANPCARVILDLDDARRPLPSYPDVLDAVAPPLPPRPDEDAPRPPAVVERRPGARGARHVEVTVSTLAGGEGEPGAMVILQDVTARVEAERELRVTRRRLAEREKLSALGSLVAGVAHEVRTPLAYLANNVHLLSRRLDQLRDAPSVDGRALHDELRPYWSAADEAVERIDRLVRDLRRFTKLQPAEATDVPLDAVVAEAADLFRAAGRSRVEIAADLRPTGLVRVDRLHVQQIVINLLDNAADASPPGATVEVATRRADAHVELTVRDRGVGIPPDVAARVFDPLFSTKKEGTGLGLSIVKDLVTRHGGTIRFTTKPGEGTTFTVRFPAAARAHDEGEGKPSAG